MMLRKHELKKLMSQQRTETGYGYCIPYDLMEEMKHHPKGELFSYFMIEKGIFVDLKKIRKKGIKNGRAR